MQIATVVIPNLNGMKYLKDCLDSLRRQTRTDFSVILIDNGSTDGSADYVAQNYPGVRVERFSENRGFCGAVNAGIRMSSTRYVILLNNDTICDAQFVEQLVAAMEAHPDCFAGSSRMVQMADPSRMDNGGDFYCALGWAYTPAKGKPVERYERARAVFSACAGAAIYRRAVFDEIGMFDEAHFCVFGGCGCIMAGEDLWPAQYVCPGCSGPACREWRQAVRCTTNSRCGMHRGTAFI